MKGVDLSIGNSDSMANLTYDPNVCTSPQDCASQTITERDTQNNMVKALDATSGGGRRRRMRRTRRRGGNKADAINQMGGRRRRIGGGDDILVKPLPMGSQTTTTQEINKEMSTLYANAVSNAQNDEGASRGGRRRMTRRMRRGKKSRKRSSRKRSSRKRSSRKR